MTDLIPLVGSENLLQRHGGPGVVGRRLLLQGGHCALGGGGFGVLHRGGGGGCVPPRGHVPGARVRLVGFPTLLLRRRGTLLGRNPLGRYLLGNTLLCNTLLGNTFLGNTLLGNVLLCHRLFIAAAFLHAELGDGFSHFNAGVILTTVERRIIAG